jgi:aryl-alcohol dehydrogenase-like predicted oxidoreductase
VSRIAIGAWAIGGWMWGGPGEAESIATIRTAVEHGVNVIDTAPAMGSGVPKKSLRRPSPKLRCVRACASPPR